MKIELAGEWKYEYTGKSHAEGSIVLPGTLNGAGAGEPVSLDTEWLSGLHNPFWHEREEYKSGTEGNLHVPFLSQPVSYYCGAVTYSRTFSVDAPDEYYLFIELSKWKLTAYIDGGCIGTVTGLCAPFVFGPFALEVGEHELAVTVDNSMQYPYRPDAHAISDALGASWNGMGGNICLISRDVFMGLQSAKKAYAEAHPVRAEVRGRNFVINGRAEYLRGTHFGGDFPLTGIPSTDSDYWEKFFDRIKMWGFNFVRCHSFCPPEAAFLAADSAGVFLQVECGMWNIFNPGDDEMFEVLMSETRAILNAFGHHPSFVFFSPSNEPGGRWYGVLKKWVELASEYNRELGYEGRRLFTAQSGWFYDTEPSKITGTDYVYFHRSAYGPIHGGMIRNHWGWKGRDYSPSLAGSRLPVISHEMGQWCSYPDFDVIDKFTGCATPGNYEIFRALAAQNGVLGLNKDFVFCSGRNQVRLLKEDIEANLRTPEISGYEYLDLHDYSGQGTAVVGLLDPFWDSKGYVTPQELRRINSDTVVLARLDRYVFKNTDDITAEFEISNYSGKTYEGGHLHWSLIETAGDTGRRHIAHGEIPVDTVPAGELTKIGGVCIPLTEIRNSIPATIRTWFNDSEDRCVAVNEWPVTIFAGEPTSTGVSFTHSLSEAQKILASGGTAVLNPYLSDMDFECPSLGIRNVFWNAQMGPNWSRELGIVADSGHPLFKHFPTERSGGWQWEDILANARGFNFPAKYSSIVRVIDDWNRNFPLSLMFEGRVGPGRLFFVSADLEGTFEDRPAAYTLKNTILNYVQSTDFNPEQEIDIDDIGRHLKPLYRGSDIIKSIRVNGAELPECVNISGINPNIPFVIHPDRLPVEFEITLKRKVNCKGVYCLPIQNDRDFMGVIREYGIKAGNSCVRGEWKNGFETQHSERMDEFTDRIIFTVYSTYSMGEAVRWKEGPKGFYKVRATEPLTVSMSSFGIDFDEETYNSSNERFWTKAAVSTRNEIEA